MINGWYLLCGAVLFAGSLAAHAESIEYAYDDLGRLISAVDHDNGQAIGYQYDAAGNLFGRHSHAVSELSVHGFSPARGMVGQELTIYGTGFGIDPGAVSVTIDAVAASVVSTETTRLIVTIPGGVSSGPIEVTTVDGSASSSSAFSVLP